LKITKKKSKSSSKTQLNSRFLLVTHSKLLGLQVNCEQNYEYGIYLSLLSSIPTGNEKSNSKLTKVEQYCIVGNKSCKQKPNECCKNYE
jgi:hypothetical protein